MTAVQQLLVRLTPEEKAEAFVELSSAPFILDEEQREQIDERLRHRDDAPAFAVMRIGDHDYIVPRLPSTHLPELPLLSPDRIVAIQAALDDPDNSLPLDEMLRQIDTGIT